MTNDNIIVSEMQSKDCSDDHKNNSDEDVRVLTYNNIVTLPVTPDSDYHKLKCIFNIDKCSRVDICLRQKNIALDDCEHRDLVLQAREFLTFID